MPFAYYARLRPAQRAIYRRSDEIATVKLPRPAELRPHAGALRDALAAEDRRRAESLCQALADGLCRQLKVPAVRVVVRAVRPHDGGGELHGLYEPESGSRPARVSLWMRTAKQARIVAFKTFLRTLLHELCHHFDYELYHLAETFHTEGFYKRESSLFHQLVVKP